MVLSHPYKALEVAQVFIGSLFKLHDFPKTIVSDKDSLFLSSFWKGLFTLQGTSLNFSSVYHPQSDGQIEASNKVLEGYLRCYAGHKRAGLSQWLPLAEWWYNSTYHSSTKLSSFEALYRYPPPRLIDYVPGTSTKVTVDQLLKIKAQVLNILTNNLIETQNQMKTYVDKKSTKRKFEEGD